jgi:hypothetical protein
MSQLSKFCRNTAFAALLLSLPADWSAAQNVTITKSIQPPVVAYGDTVTICLTITASNTPEADICWVLDVTGSMSTEISLIQTDLTSFTNQLATSGINYQNGLVAFRDINTNDSQGSNDCASATAMATYPLTPNNTTFLSYISAQMAEGGGDTPESGLEGIQAAVMPTTYCGLNTTPMAWRPGASHTIIVISDAGFHSVEYDGLSSLSIFSFPASLYAAGYTIDVIGENCSVPGNTCTNSTATCTTCDPQTIAAEAGGIWLDIHTADWSSLMATLGAQVANLTNVLIQDPLPPGLVPIPGGASGESIVGGTVYFPIPSISFTGTPTPLVVCFPATVTSNQPGYINNTASFSAAGITAVSSNSVSIWNIGPTPTATPTSTPTFTATFTPTSTPTCTDTFTPSSTPTPTATNTPTSTPTCVPLVWPDPFDPKHAVNGVLKIGCLAPGSTVSIYTISGEKIWSSDQSSFVYGSPFTGTWNGTNENGVPVSPGIYFYVIQSGGKVTAKGKFLVVKTP